MKKSGFTLMELMVYIAIMGIVVLVAGQAFSDSSRMRVRTESMLKASEVANNIASMLKDDIAQMGAKSSKESGYDANYFDNFKIDAMHFVYMDPDNTDNTKKDSSSYAITTDANGFATISMKRIRYDQNDHYEAVELISWFVEDKVLKRSCQTIAGTATGECPTLVDDENAPVVEMAQGVSRFTLLEGIPSVSEELSSVLPSTSHTVNEFRLIPRFGDNNIEAVNVIPPAGSATVTLTGFIANYDFENNEPISIESSIKKNQVFLGNVGSTSGSWKDLCTQVTLSKNIEYEISFAMPGSADDASSMFCPGRDHMSVGFRKVSDGSKPAGINDFLFYPTAIDDDGSNIRKMRFSVNEEIKEVCLGFTFASFSPIAATGSIKLSNVKLKKVENANYRFDNASSVPITEKKFVKAIQLQISIEKKGETGVGSIIIATPSNGPRD